MVWTFVLPQNSYVEILSPKSDGIRRWGLWQVIKLWEWSHHEDN